MIFKPEVLLPFPGQAVHNLCHFAFREGSRFSSDAALFAQMSSYSRWSSTRGRPCKTVSWGWNPRRTKLGRSEVPTLRLSVLRSPFSADSRSPFSEGGFRLWRHRPTNETPSPRWTGNLFESLNHKTWILGLRIRGETVVLQQLTAQCTTSCMTNTKTNKCNKTRPAGPTGALYIIMKVKFRSGVGQKARKTVTSVHKVN